MAKVGIGYFGRKEESKKGPSEKDVVEAVRKFQEQGGLIKKLPDEVISGNNLIGRKYGCYENLGESTE